jgi:hypothetical protein
VEARAQSSGGDEVVVDRVAPKGFGYVEIHADGGGPPGPVIGVSGRLDAGTHDDVSVEVEQPLGTGNTTVWPVLHAEDNGNDSFDYPAAGQPVTFGEGGGGPPSRSSLPPGSGRRSGLGNDAKIQPVPTGFSVGAADVAQAEGRRRRR